MRLFDKHTSRSQSTPYLRYNLRCMSFLPSTVANYFTSNLTKNLTYLLERNRDKF
jgi:hypothetical protein